MAEMENPWKSIRLSDYENHMKLNTVMQLQALNSMMKEQLLAYPVRSVMILGVAGGNGLEHISPEKYTRVYGVDVNGEYLREVQRRYQGLENILQCLCLDLVSESDQLPPAELLIANLLVEYIGYECFQKVIAQVKPKYISCGIQINPDQEFVSDSPYLHSFDGLSGIHHQMETGELIRHVCDKGYAFVASKEYSLPNGKKLLQIDFRENREEPVRKGNSYENNSW